MMVISMLNYQADEYMESAVARLTEPSLKALGMTIGAEIRNGRPRSVSSSSPQSNTFHQPVVTPPRSDCGSSSKSLALKEVTEVLSKYIRHVKQHKALLQSPESAQKFLLAHIAHNADNARLKDQQQGSQAPLGKQDSMPYYDWVRTTGVNDTSCPYSFAFFCCLISGSGSHCLASMDQKYLAREMCSHLAALCRQYNDYGSATRDDAEGNLNSLHFSEFTEEDEQSLSSLVTAEASEDGVRGHGLQKAKRLLMKVAGIERTCMQVCWDGLSPSLDEGLEN